MPVRSEQPLEPGEGEFDRVQVRAVRRQVQQTAPGRLDGRPDRGRLVARQVVEDDRVSRPEGRHQDGGDVLPEPPAGHGAVEHLGGGHPVRPHGGGEGERLVMPVRDRPDHRLAAGGVPAPPFNFGVRGRLVHEHHPARLGSRAGRHARRGGLPARPGGFFLIVEY